MVSQWYHGRVASFWCGMQSALTPLYHLTKRVLLLKKELLQAAAEEQMRMKYTSLEQCHSSVPVAIETTGVFGSETLSLLRELANVSSNCLLTPALSTT